MTNQSTTDNLIEMRLTTMADAIINHIAHDGYQTSITSIDAKHDRSMREVCSLDKTHIYIHN